MIVERFCTCTFEERKLAFEWQIETEIKHQLTMYINFLNSEIDLDLRKHQIESDLKNYELIFKSTYKELENIEITLSYPPNFNRIHKSLGISQMKEFKSEFRNNQFNQYRDYHKAKCPILDINRIENGDTRPIIYHMPYSTNYFFFLELKRYYNKTYLDTANEVKTTKPDFFTDTQFEIFTKLDTNYNTATNAMLSKYRFIFQYLKQEKGFNNYNSKNYIDFIKEKKGIEFSLISDKTGKVKENAYKRFKEILG